MACRHLALIIPDQLLTAPRFFLRSKLPINCHAISINYYSFEGTMAGVLAWII